MLMMNVANDRDIIHNFEEFVRNAAFPCVGAKSALNKGQMHFVLADDICSAWDDLRILPHVSALAKHYREKPDLFQTLVVIFRRSDRLTERRFERAIWDRLQSLSDKDEWLGQPVDPRVSTDPEDPHFAVSFAGEAFFIVGLHPNASRPARRFDHPVMVFNLHDQFERLRAEGRYDPLRNTIMKRDEQLAGSMNPMLAQHGEGSAARQYSGRNVEDEWVCPFSRKSEAA
ncbi:MAG: YqcI/YcgG family protein [Sphingomonadaceae bacterium]|nr:YqcI/YcgG family protein [Sphingomonadaceae bacterium]